MYLSLAEPIWDLTIEWILAKELSKDIDQNDGTNFPSLLATRCKLKTKNNTIREYNPKLVKAKLK